jgi:hypothetical protein
MTKIIDFKTKKPAENPHIDLSIVDVLKKASESDSAKTATRLLIILENDEQGEHWRHNLSDMDLLWMAEHMRIRALTGPEDDLD